MTTVMYIHLTYENYKRLEEQMKAFKETTHKTVTGFHHKSVRLQIDESTVMEFHGPCVGGYGHMEGQAAHPQPDKPEGQ